MLSGRRTTPGTSSTAMLPAELWEHIVCLRRGEKAPGPVYVQGDQAASELLLAASRETRVSTPCPALTPRPATWLCLCFKNFQWAHYEASQLMLRN